MVEPQVGGLIAGGPVCWVSGARRVIVGFGNALSAYIIEEDGQPKQTASFQGHESRVVAVVSIGALRVASASIDGTVRVWGVEDGSLLRTVDFGQPLLDMVAVSDGRVVVTSATEVGLLTLQRGSLLVSEKVRLLRDLSNTPRRRVASSADGSVVVTIGGNHLTFAFIDNEVVTTVKVSGNISLTAVAISRDGSSLAAGTTTGSIVVYRDISPFRMQGGGAHVLPTTTADYSHLHWHSSSVLSLRFSGYGNILYSGGCEAVLVVWKMTRTDFGKRSFKPRLSGAIWGISPSPNESRIALTHADNSVRFIDTLTLAITATLRGISTAHLRNLSPWDVPRGSRAASKILRLTAEPGNSGCVLVSGVSNSVQLYDVSRGAHVADLQIIPRNTVFQGGEIDVSKLTPDALSVRHVAVSMDKRFMVSVTRDVHPLTESKACTIVRYMETLKFWNYNGGSGRIDLISRVDEPHGAIGEIMSIAFHPSLPILATASTCGTFKFWRAVFVEGSPGNVLWRCECTESYREAPCTSLSFSSDGSMLAVGCESSITLWCFEDFCDKLGLNDVNIDKTLISSRSPGSLKLTYLHSLIHPPLEESIAYVSFVAANSPLLLAATCHGLYLWDVLERRIWWSSRIVHRPECTVVDTSSGRFAVVLKMPSSHAAVASRKEETSSIATAKASRNPQQNGFRNRVQKSLSQNEKAAKLKRQRRNDIGRRCGTQGSGLIKPKPEGLMQEIKMDTAVALFTASSAVPLAISRVPSGTDVSGIAFLPSQRCSNLTAKAIVCFDTNMEIIRVPTAENDVISDVTQNGEGNQEITNIFADKAILGDLLGSSWRNGFADHDVGRKPDKAVPLNVASAEAELIPIHNILGKFLDGPVGTQPPVSSFALPLLGELVGVVHSSAKYSNTPMDEAVNAANRNILDKIESVAEDSATGTSKLGSLNDVGDVDLNSMSAFLKSIVPNDSS